MLLGSVCILLFTISPYFAQGSLTGKVCDSVLAPIPFATVALIKKNDSTVIKGSIADENGSYSITGFPSGAYLLKIFAIGFKDQVSPPFDADSASQLELPPVQMQPAWQHLNEVQVSAIHRTIEFKNGNIIVNVENSPLAKGNTVYDLLYKLPGVSIDDNNITLQGKSGVIFLIDGRTQQVSNQQLIALLKSMNAESVEKIEILKNPPVRYDASGTSGMINIQTKKAQLLGVSGSVYSSFSQSLRGNLLSGMTLNYKTEKLTLFSGFDYNYTGSQTSERLNRAILSGADQTVLNEQNTRIQTGTSYTYKAGIDWNPNKKNTLGFKIDGEYGNSKATGNGVTQVSGLNNMGFDHLNAIQLIPDNWTLLNNNVHAEHLFDTSGTALNFTADYTILSEKAISYNESHFLDVLGQEALPNDIFQGTNNSNTHILASKLDFSKHLNSSSSFETGLKASLVDVHNNYLFERQSNTTGLFYNDTSQTNNFSYTETTMAAYFNYLKSYKKVNGQFGLRAEDTRIQGQNSGNNFRIDRTYLNVFPNVSLDFEQSVNNNFQLNINRRIDRPAYSDLNPFRDYHDPYSYSEGNPYLQPHYSNTIELTHSFKKTLVNSLSYTRIQNVMLHYTEQNDTTKVMVESVKNMDYSEAFTWSCFYQKDLKPWWAVSINLIASYETYKGDFRGQNFYTARVYYNGYMTHTLVLPKKMKVEINGFYRGPKYNGIVLVQQLWTASIAVKRSFYNDKLDCSIGVTDIFNTCNFHTGTTIGNQNWNFYTTTDLRRVTFSIHYNFGKLKFSSVDRTSNEQEKGRLKH